MTATRTKTSEKINMRPNTRVLVTLDDGSTKVTHTRSLPWQLGDGTWLVLVEGIAGGYDLNRIERHEIPLNTKGLISEPQHT